MPGVNKVILIGNLGADPEIRYTAGGQPVGEMRLATSEQWKDKDGQKQERVEWHRLVVWGKTAEVCAKHLAKGRQVYVEGRLQTRKWDNKEGVTRYTTEIVVNDVQFLGSKDGQAGDQRRDRDDGPPAPDGDAGNGGGFGGGRRGMDDDIPFSACAIELEPSAVARVLRRAV